MTDELLRFLEVWLLKKIFFSSLVIVKVQLSFIYVLRNLF